MLGCGDLPFDYLEYLVSRLDVPLLYVPGNHDASLQMPDMTWMPLRSELRPMPGPQGCVNIDGRLVEVAGLRIAGLGGSLRYKEGANQYSRGFQDGQRLVFGLESLRRLPSCMVPVPEVSSDAPRPRGN